MEGVCLFVQVCHNCKTDHTEEKMERINVRTQAMFIVASLTNQKKKWWRKRLQPKQCSWSQLWPIKRKKWRREGEDTRPDNDEEILVTFSSSPGLLLSHKIYGWLNLIYIMLLFWFNLVKFNNGMSYIRGFVAFSHSESPIFVDE